MRRIVRFREQIIGSSQSWLSRLTLPGIDAQPALSAVCCCLQCTVLPPSPELPSVITGGTHIKPYTSISAIWGAVSAFRVREFALRLGTCAAYLNLDEIK